MVTGSPDGGLGAAIEPRDPLERASYGVRQTLCASTIFPSWLARRLLAPLVWTRKSIGKGESQGWLPRLRLALFWALVKRAFVKGTRARRALKATKKPTVHG